MAEIYLRNLTGRELVLPSYSRYQLRDNRREILDLLRSEFRRRAREPPRELIQSEKPLLCTDELCHRHRVDRRPSESLERRLAHGERRDECRGEGIAAAGAV